MLLLLFLKVPLMLLPIAHTFPRFKLTKAVVAGM